MIVLINFNTYLGGGETLFVRFTEFLEQNNYPYFALCAKDSFIVKELSRLEIPKIKYKEIDNYHDYYYLNDKERESLISVILSSLSFENETRFVTFCLRDLYTVVALSRKVEKCSISHLILHSQDYLYVCQTLFDKLIYKLFSIRRFDNYNVRIANRKLLTNVNERNGLIPMASLGVNLWKKELDIDIPLEYIVPLPTIVNSFDNSVIKKDLVDKSIIWIGRLVDFKFPALFAMFEYINKNKEYSLTVVGSGDQKKIKKYIKNNKIDTSRINFIGQINYSDLEKTISKHSIGYATGTSIIEIAQMGLPVIMALLNYDHKNFNRQICGGLFCNTTKGNIGEDLLLTKVNSIKTTISDVIDLIEKDYFQAASDCYNHVFKEFSADTNFQKYLNRIENTETYNQKEFKIPKATYFRRFIFRLLK